MAEDVALAAAEAKRNRMAETDEVLADEAAALATTKRAALAVAYDAAVAAAEADVYRRPDADAVETDVVAAAALIAPNAENALVANAREENATAMSCYAQMQEGLSGYTR